MSSSVHRQTVFIVDDDAAVRDSLALLLSLRGYATAVFANAEDFLNALEPNWCGCLVVDICMPGMSGLDLQLALARHPQKMPVIIITGHGDIAAARQAFKANAVDFFEKPFDDDQLLQAIKNALGGLAGSDEGNVQGAGIAALSSREREVMALVVEGLDNRSLATRLGISPRTVEVHKSRMMAKVGARNLAELMRIAHASRRGK